MADNNQNPNNTETPKVDLTPTSNSQVETPKQEGDPTQQPTQPNPAELNFRKLENELEKERKARATLENKIKAQEEQELKKKGEFEELYNKSQADLIAKDAEISNSKKEIALQSKILQAGISPTKANLARLALQEKGVNYNAETSSLEGFEEAIATLKVEYPEMFGSTPAGTVGTTNTGAGGTPQGKLRASDIANLSPQEYANRQEEIQKAMNSGNVNWDE
jgi:hypothetical protein